MRKWTILVACAVSPIAFGQTVRVLNNQGSGIDQEYDAAYSTRHEATISGYVTGKIKGDAANGMAENMSILVRDSKGKVHQVDLGPAWFVAEQVAHINMGDYVKVTGDPMVLRHKSGPSEHVFVARRIIKNNQALALRDNSGMPYWVAYRSGNVQAGKNSVSGTIVSENPVNAENQQENGYQLQTGNGMVNIALAPSWYLQQQGMGFKVGDNVTVYTGSQPVSFNGAILADGIYGGGNSFVFRPGGVPVWQGWNSWNPANFVGN